MKKTRFALVLVTIIMLFSSCSFTNNIKNTGLFDCYLIPADYYVVWSSDTPDSVYILDHRNGELLTDEKLTILESIINALSETYSFGSEIVDKDRKEFVNVSEFNTTEYKNMLARRKEQSDEVCKNAEMIIYACSSEQRSNIQNGVLNLKDVEYTICVSDRWTVKDKNAECLFLGYKFGYTNLLYAWWDEIISGEYSFYQTVQIKELYYTHTGIIPTFFINRNASK